MFLLCVIGERSVETSEPNSHIVVLGNEKGGSGKSTTAMHVVVALLLDGYGVGTIDLDARQRTLSRYIDNRRVYANRHGLAIILPEHRIVEASSAENQSDARADEFERLTAAVRDLAAANDFVVIDCPGSDSHLARLGHGLADTLITPVNDSFVDIDLLANVNPETFDVIGPSFYAEMVWEQRKHRMLRDGASIDWLVMRNRLSSLDARNKRRTHDVLERLAGRVGFRLAPGFGERVIYRELFLQGLTLLDLGGETGPDLTMSHVAARQELRGLMSALTLPKANRPVRARAARTPDMVAANSEIRLESQETVPNL